MGDPGLWVLGCAFSTPRMILPTVHLGDSDLVVSGS